MKSQLTFRLGWYATGLSLLCSSSLLFGVALDIQVLPSGIQTNGDAAATEVANWGTYWITKDSQGNYHATCTYNYDAAMHSQSSIPGSVYCVCDWDGTAGDDINFGAVLPNGTGTWLGNPAIQVIDGTQYAYLLMDIHWTNVVGITTWGTIGLMTPGYGIVALTNNLPIPTTPGWQHLELPIDPTLKNLGSIAGVCIYRWASAGAPSHAEFWVDNVQLIARAAQVPPPSLTLNPFQATPGLTIQTAPSAGEYDRQNVATVSGNYSWVGAGSAPVTYAMTVTNYPGTNHPNFQTQIFLASDGTGMPGTGSAPDWDAPNCIFLEIQNLASGAATATFRWKTNDPGDNAMIWNGAYNPVATLDEPNGPNGTWSLSFVNDTQVTLTSPTGLSTNFPFSDAATLQSSFPQGATVAYFGAMPNSTNNPGQGVVISRIKISGPSGVITPINDAFSGGALDTATWVVRAADPAALSVASGNEHWNLSWTVPDNNFKLQSAASIIGPWTDVSEVTNAAQRGTLKILPLQDASLPSKPTGFFRMVKPMPTQLQVLLPGETNAPGTLTGKTGTPDTQYNNNPFDVTVHACDAQWNIITTCKDTVHFTSSDSAAVLPKDTALTNGTAIITGAMTLVSPGTWTITASDVTSQTVSNGVSAAIAIQ